MSDRDMIMASVDEGYWRPAAAELLGFLNEFNWDLLEMIPAAARDEAIRSEAENRARRVAENLWG